mgnify:CR=1 FL=1
MPPQDICALLVVDMQNDFVLAGAPLCVAGALETVPRIRVVLEAFRERGLPILHVIREHRPDGSDVEITRRDRFRETGGFLIPGTPGCDIVDALQPQSGEDRIVKTRFSGFFQTRLDDCLRRHRVRRLVLTGTQLPHCVRATAVDGLSLDYSVIVLRDACSSQTLDIHEANLRDLEALGIRCPTVERFLRDEARRIAPSPEPSRGA